MAADAPAADAADALTRASVLEALRLVEDPEIHRSIVDLEMVRSIEVERGRVRVEVALTVSGCPLRAELTRRVTDAVSPLPGVGAVDVELTVMTDAERAALRDKLAGGAGDGHGQAGPRPQAMGHAEGRPIPFSTAGSTTRVLGVTSGKGGVGKSTLTVNLAVALARRDHTVGLLDADVYGYSVPKMLGVDHDAVQIDDMLIPPEANGVRCMSVGFLVESDETPVMWRGPMLHKLLEEFLTRVYWDQPDYLIFDMPPGTGDVALSMHNYLPQGEMLIVTTPQPAAQRVAQRSGSMAAKVNTPVLGVIENMSWFTAPDGSRHELFGRGGGSELAEKLGVPLLGQVPFDPAVREGADVGRPIVVTEPESEAARAIDSIAAWLEENKPRRRFRRELSVT